MDKDQIRSKAEELAEKLKDKTSELTGDEGAETEGVGEQVKGKARDLLGKLKNAGRETKDKVREKIEPDSSYREEDDDQDIEEVA
jgi:uncharacterized protein YjbJ (UPF0337 family)